MIDADALPPFVRERLRALLLERSHALVLGFDPDWTLREIHGDAAFHGIDTDAPAARIAALQDLFVGIDVGDDQEIPFVELANGRSVHVYLLADGESFHLLLLDADEARATQRSQQQLANEAVLAGHAKSKAIDALRNIRNELERQRARLEEANALKNAFIATMSHEFRTPLTSAFGHLRLLEQQLPPGESGDALQAVRRSLTYLFALAENLLEYGRGEAGGGLLYPTDIDLDALLADCEAMFCPLAVAKNLVFRATLERSDATTPRFDEVKLRQIVINLLSNAMRYTHSGEVMLALRWADARLHVEVSDTGIGIAPEFQARVFHPFNSGAQSGSRGAGLGLSIVRRLVEQMQGTLALQSELGVGTRFTLDLPGAAASPSTNDAAPLHGRVLVVEDDVDVSRLLEVAFEGIGLDVRVVGEAAAAIEVALAEPPRLLVFDMHLPDLSGCEAVFRLRAQGYRGAILMLSANASADARDAALRAGADRYLTKPIDFAKLEAVARELLARE